jgi:hypothetical protein
VKGILGSICISKKLLSKNCPNLSLQVHEDAQDQWIHKGWYGEHRHAGKLGSGIPVYVPNFWMRFVTTPFFVAKSQTQVSRFLIFQKNPH